MIILVYKSTAVTASEVFGGKLEGADESKFKTATL
jgi:hypothetical protein